MRAPTTRSRPRRRVARRSELILPSVLVAVLAGTAACSGGDDEVSATTSAAPTTTTIPPRLDDGVLSIGLFLPRTGPGAALGEPMISAIENEVLKINAAGGVLGNPVGLTPVDENGGTGIGELLAAGVDAIVGPASSTVALSQLDDAVNLTTGVVTCSPSATALALDAYPDNKFFFRTVPSDSLQMAAIVRRAERTGVGSVAVGYLDDRYGRGLVEAFIAEAETRGRLEVGPQVGFEANQEDFSADVAELLADEPLLIVVLGDADDGSRFLAAIDEATAGSPPQVIVNEAIRGGRQTIKALSTEFRENLSGVAPIATSLDDDGPPGYFSANAVDCVNLIALAAVQAQSDAPPRIQANMASVSVGGRVCTSFVDCAGKLDDGLRIDYNGLSGSVDLSTTTGDLVRAWFEVFGFDEEGGDHQLETAPPFEVQ